MLARRTTTEQPLRHEGNQLQRYAPKKTIESAMYAKVRDFVVTHWKAAEALTKPDSGPHARRTGIKLNFGGVSVEPDVYGVLVSNSTELPLMGEGKLRMGGRTGKPTSPKKGWRASTLELVVLAESPVAHERPAARTQHLVAVRGSGVM